MLWIALALPDLPLETCCRNDAPEAPQAPMAVVRQHRIALVNAAARAVGIEIGQQRTGALAMYPALRLIERDATREREALEGLALALLRFTPSVVPVHGGRDVYGVLLEVRGSLHLFGGFVPLVHAVRYTAAELGLRAELAAFDTPTGAWLLAQGEITKQRTKPQTQPPSSAQGASTAQADPYAPLDALPPCVLDTAQLHLAAFESLGLATLAALRRLPRNGLARRFGQALLDELDRAYGDLSDPREPLVAPAEFRARLELFARVEHADALLFGARRLLMQLVGWLQARHAAVRAFTLVLDHDADARTPKRVDITVALGAASRDLDHLVLLLREHLARTTLAAPVLDIELVATRIETLAAPNTELFPSPVSEAEGLARLTERLTARLGRDAVVRIELVADHRPERAQRWRKSGERAARDANAPRPRLVRPAWLLDVPRRLAVRGNSPYYEGRLTLVAGPERIEAGWWDGPEHLALRDYFIAETDDARLMWVYRERARGDEAWYLHGKFA